MDEQLMFLAEQAIEMGNTCSIEELEHMRCEALNEVKTDKVIKFIDNFWTTAIDIANKRATTQSGNSEAVACE